MKIAIVDTACDYLFGFIRSISSIYQLDILFRLLMYVTNRILL